MNNITDKILEPRDKHLPSHSSGVHGDAEGAVVGGGEEFGGGHLGEATHRERPKYSGHLFAPCEFHVCKGLWVVMVLGLLVVWICCVFRFPQVVTGWWGGVWGGVQVVGWFRCWGFLYMLIDIYLGRMVG